jgi:hypothetical protein
MNRLAIFFLSALWLSSAAAAEAPASVAELFVTPENVKLVREADRVDVCILRHIEPTTRADGSIDWNSERYEETAFTPVPAATAKTFRDLVLNEKTYDWKAGSGGHRPQFYLRLRFHHGADIIAVDFCFMCHVLSVTRNGAELGHANFGRNGDLFLQAFLKVFPDDEPLKRVAKEAGLPP